MEPREQLNDTRTEILQAIAEGFSHQGIATPDEVAERLGRRVTDIRAHLEWLEREGYIGHYPTGFAGQEMADTYGLLPDGRETIEQSTEAC